MKGIIALVIVILISAAARNYFRPVNWDAEFKKDPQLALIQFADKANKDEKGREENGVVFDGAEVSAARVLTLNYTHTKLLSRNIPTAQLGASLPAMMQIICETRELDPVFRNGVMVRFRLRAADKETLFMQRVNRDKCMELIGSDTGVSTATPTAMMKCRAIPPGEDRDACMQHFSQ